MDRSRVALQVDFELKVSARHHHGHAVVADRARYEHAVARPRTVRAKLDAGGNDADPGRRDVQAVGRPALDDLRVAGRDRYAGGKRRSRHRCGDAAQVGNRETFLDDEAGRERDRPRARHREIVDRPVDREVADVAAGEEDRLDDVGVGREGEPHAVHVEQRRVAERREQRIVELRDEQLFDKGSCRLAARTMSERDDVLAKSWTSPRRHAGTLSRRPANRP